MFLFLLQFVMKFIDQLVGKGLTMWTILELITLNLAWMLVLAVPMSVLVAVLMAFGLLAIYYSIESDIRDSKFLLILLIGLAAFVAGGWILVTKLTVAVLLTKVAGLILLVLGLFLLVEFPDIMQYQVEGFSKTGVFFGIIFFIVGVWLLIFA
jgi:hypothetical protein